MTPVQSLAAKFRRALKNETGVHLTLEELRAFTELGGLKIASDAEIEELIASWNSSP